MKTKLTFLLLLFFYSSVYAQPITIGSGGDFPTLEEAQSEIFAGDTVIVFNGIYDDGSQFLENLNGTVSEPILIKSETLHGAIFQGGTEAIHLINCSYLILDGFVVEQQNGNGINIDDGGDYSTPTHHIMVKNCLFQNMAASGNNDFLKLSGLDDFLISNCQFINGAAGGSGVDMVGCHHGVIEDCLFDAAGVTGIQNKGGTQFIRMQRNVFKDIAQRAINLGGSTGLQFFRPPLPTPIVDAFEAADLEVFSNIFIGSWAPIAYVGAVRVKVYNNTFYKPENWVIRILQETTVDGFLTCADNEFINNIIYLDNDLTEVNIGPNTNAESFTIENNLWFNESSNNWTPGLPVNDPTQIITDPLFVNAVNSDFNLQEMSPAIEMGQLLEIPDTDFYMMPFHEPPSIGAIEGFPVVSANANLASFDVLLYPNPAHKMITIEADDAIDRISIYNLTGQLVLENTNVNIISVKKLCNGAYIVKAAVGGAVWNERLLIVRR